MSEIRFTLDIVEADDERVINIIMELFPLGTMDIKWRLKNVFVVFVHDYRRLITVEKWYRFANFKDVFYPTS